MKMTHTQTYLVKICGITKEKEVEYINEAKPDFAGFVLFVSKSKRNLTIDKATELLKHLNQEINSVAVTVAPDRHQIKMIEAAGFDYIQIHGTISETLLDEITIPIIKAFNVNDLSEYEIYHSHERVVGYVFDAQTPGSGERFDWTVLDDVPRDEKFAMLAGGLNPSNVEKALSVTKLMGADTSSGVEYEDGDGKDPKKIADFVRKVRRMKENHI